MKGFVKLSKKELKSVKGGILVARPLYGVPVRLLQPLYGIGVVK